MTDEPLTRPDPTTDRRRTGVWENEGGPLAVRSSLATEAPIPDDATTRWMRAVALSDLPDEGAIHLELSGVPICLARSDGATHALLDECSHGQVALSDGEIADGVVDCWLHGSSFDLVTGVPTGPPAIVPVPVYRVRIVADVVEVAIESPATTVSRSASEQGP